ncbi:LptF/LptG family permease [Albibacterium bauzanense]|uniref:Lipopolysaccharide export system permease protein n=1 Tax=Albibacterium bauzanense TaxID=653929 RepID=A0A4R1LWA6_9SPHI|nr:LptF/LptG family permease [Albibacterium bauzanense]TCK82704.1 lipopolysaccharide export system permease protein [Albibacterium bauzanense]
MKKIHVLVLKAFIKPFIVTFFIVMFVLLMLFLFKYIDDLIGKGFEWYVILQLLWYASATNVAMALPLSMLLSSIMTFGNLGESSELTAIKAAGISLRKAMMPLIIFVSLFSMSAFLFSDYMLPIANLKMGSLLYDVREKKADFLITEGVFNNSIPGYAIRAKSKSEKGSKLEDLIIYQHTPNTSGTNVLMAKEGKMYNSPDNNYMVLELKDGVRYEETSGSRTYNPRQLFTRYYFDQTEQKFDMSAFQMKRTDENLFKSHYAMLNLRQLEYYADSISHYNDSLRQEVFQELEPYYKIYSQYSSAKNAADPVNYKNNLLEIIPEDNRMIAIAEAQSQVRYIQDVLSIKSTIDNEYSSSIRRYLMEYQRKFTLSVVCLVFFSIGAPLGAIIRKGGLGLPVVMAIIFFLIYYVISTLAEKSAREGNMDATLGMWTAIIILAPLGIFLTYKAATDSALFDIEQYKLTLKNLWDKLRKRISA